MSPSSSPVAPQNHPFPACLPLTLLAHNRWRLTDHCSGRGFSVRICLHQGQPPRGGIHTPISTVCRAVWARTLQFGCRGLAFQREKERPPLGFQEGGLDSVTEAQAQRSTTRGHGLPVWLLTGCHLLGTQEARPHRVDRSNEWPALAAEGSSTGCSRCSVTPTLRGPFLLPSQGHGPGDSAAGRCPQCGRQDVRRRDRPSP